MKKIFEKFFKEITFFGGIAFYLFLVILFFAIGKEEYSITLLIVLIGIYFVSAIIRLFYFKPRPKKEHYENLIEKLDASSFPSIHAARIVFLLFFSIYFFKLIIHWMLLLSGISILVLYSRIYLKKHDIIDLMGGILLGILGFLIVFALSNPL